MLSRLLPFLLVPALLACSKSDSNPIVDFGEGEGISYRNSQNLPVGPHDPTDWTSDADWNKQERNLFPELSFDLNGTQQQGLVSPSSAYPNPAAGGVANWALNTVRTGSGSFGSYSVRAVLVNRKYQTRLRLGPSDFTMGTGFTMNYIGAGLETNELYRLYYVVYNASGLVLKGHGDVRYSPQ